MSLRETSSNHINLASVSLEEGRDLFGSHADLLNVADFSSLGLVGWEHVLGAVDIAAEVEVVDLLGVSAIAVTANDQVEKSVRRGHDVQTFHHSQELLRCNVLRLRAIKVLEPWLEKNTVGTDVFVESRHHFNHLIFVGICENLFEFTAS